MFQDALQDHQCYQNLGIMGGWNFVKVIFNSFVKVSMQTLSVFFFNKILILSVQFRACFEQM